MINIESYLNDGANWQAQCVLACLRSHKDWALESSYDREKGIHKAYITVHRYICCRENGYVFAIRYGVNQHNFAVFEAANSDAIFVVENEEFFMDNGTYEIVRKECESKYDCTKRFSCGEITKCVEYIVKECNKWVQKMEGKDVSEFNMNFNIN